MTKIWLKLNGVWFKRLWLKLNQNLLSKSSLLYKLHFSRGSLIKLLPRWATCSFASVAFKVASPTLCLREHNAVGSVYMVWDHRSHRGRCCRRYADEWECLRLPGGQWRGTLRGQRLFRFIHTADLTGFADRGLNHTCTFKPDSFLLSWAETA